MIILILINMICFALTSILSLPSTVIQPDLTRKCVYGTLRNRMLAPKDNRGIINNFSSYFVDKVALPHTMPKLEKGDTCPNLIRSSAPGIQSVCQIS